jgi:subtilase family serine protease
VKNRGDLEASSTYISYYIDKVYVGWHLIEDIEPGTTVTRPFTWTTQRGSFTFTAVADEANNILESDESNNTKTVSLPAPDLVIDRVKWSPANPIEFSPVTFTAVIKNQGPGQAPGTLLSCYIDGTTFLSFDTGAIDPGGTAEVAFAYAFQSGEHSIRLIADGNDAVTEVSEANNENTVRFSVQVQPTSALPAAPESANVTAPTTPAPVPTTPVIPGENLASGNNTPARDISSNITAGPPGWQNAVQNRWLIMGVAALGIGAIGVLLLIRRKSSKK